jgi:glycerol-3-phosphate dehydrogenase
VTSLARTPSRQAGQVEAVHTHDVLVIGSGVGGLTVAIETPDLQVGLLTKTRLGQGGSSPMPTIPWPPRTG